MAEIKALEVTEVENLLTKGAKLVTIISEAAFENFYIRGQYILPFIPESISFLQEEIPLDHPIIIGREEDADIVAERLQEVGFNNIMGYTHFDVNRWTMEQDNLDMILNTDMEEFCIDLKHQKDAIVIDLRQEEECLMGYVKGALNIPISILCQKAKALEEQKQLFVYCSDGFRSMLASCILRNMGLTNVKNLLLGFNDFNEEDIEIVKPKKN